MKKIRSVPLIAAFILTGCGQQSQPVPAAAAVASPTETRLPPAETATVPPIETPTEIAANADPALFGAILQTDIQAFSLEAVANAIFVKVMDGFVATGGILQYQVTGVTIFPAGDGSLYAEINYDVRTTDPTWLSDGGTQGNDNWLNDKCSRFDFVTTETEFQLTNRRMCS